MAGNKFQIKRTGVASRTPNTTNVSNTAYIDVGELALNFADRILYSSNGSVSFEIGANVTNQNITGTLTANGGIGTANQVLFTSGSGIYWGNIGDVAQGEPGEGVANGGITGDILVKASGTDYDTEWTSDISVTTISIGNTLQQSNTANTTVTTATTISQWPTASYASSKAVITATSNGERQVSELLISYNSSNAFATEYGILVTGATLFTVDCSLSGGNVVIEVSSTSTTATNYTIHEILTEV